MKIILMITLLIVSTLAFGQKNCDLNSNNEAVQRVNDTFDRGEMSGEDHMIALKELYSVRLGLIAECVQNDSTNNLSKIELQDTIPKIEAELAQYIEEMNAAIQLSIARDRIGMATEMAYERDLHKKEIKALIRKIRSLLKK